MGFTREDEKSMREMNMTDQQVYHCSGDSIVVSVLMALFGSMLFDEETLKNKIENYVETIKNT